MKSKKHNKVDFNVNDFFPFIDGLDISINFSLVIFFASFFFESVDARISIIILCSILSLSFASRILDLKVYKLFQKSKLVNVNFFLILFVLYLTPVFIQDNFPIFLSLGIFAVFRVFFGILISFSYRNLMINNQKTITKILDLKYWLLLSLGLAAGIFICLLINEIYSNDYLNKGGWKILYLIVSMILLTIYFFSRLIAKKEVNLDFQLEDKQNSYPFKEILNGFIIFIPFLCFLLFISSYWLPKFSNPENLYFLSFGFLYLFLTVLFFVFVTPLANLVGKRRSIIFFNFSIFIISFFVSFINHTSSYSIDFLKLFLSIVSSFSICSFIFQIKLRKIDDFLCISLFNLTIFLVAVLSPLVFYITINYALNYSAIYIFLSIVYFVNYITFLTKKDG